MLRTPWATWIQPRSVLIGAGRWGSTHPQFGIPVTWDDVAGARAIVEGVREPDRQSAERRSTASALFHEPGTATSRALTLPIDAPAAASLALWVAIGITLRAIF